MVFVESYLRVVVDLGFADSISGVFGEENLRKLLFHLGFNP
ncbi:hypothetical protein HanRHA438_Chr08g0359071 [Helianthus annuus]|nr:hypothetical protein HanHA89_Chr08g0304631 [Helianthus annuus]KAJ0898635.1 hypothetical protein HanRHA438_Chr08g0359071 [Helianthus annuus]